MQDKWIDARPALRHDSGMSTMTAEQRAEILRTFGVPCLRAGQEELISLALAGHHTLGVLPTGHGKSLCYQAVAYLSDGLSVVVSPLIALMRDQVQSLRNRGIAAARYDSTLTDEERENLLKEVAAGRLQLLFVAPESLESAPLTAALSVARLQLFVVDEAHCVSEWGHSFRPDYLRLPTWQRARGFRNVMALTATATRRVQDDLCRAFHISPDCVVAHSPYRPNIERLVMAAEDVGGALLQFMQEPEHRPAIVYTRTRKGAENMAAYLQQAGFAVGCYHAGVNAEQREQLQDDFLANVKDVLVATIAFGMGVDKPDVRSVVHVNLPGSPEAYLQESGRAGRDGLPCTALVLLQAADVTDARNRVLAAEPDVEGVLRAVRMLLPAGQRVVSLWELGTLCDVPEDVPQRALEMLQALGAVVLEGRGAKYYKVRPLFPISTITDGRDAAETARLRWLDKNREGEVEAAAEAWNCSYAEALEQLRECESAGEWRLTLRQQSLCLRGTGVVQARDVAAELSAAYARRTSAGLERLAQLLSMLKGEQGCLNAALERYFTGTSRPDCGHCAACLSSLPSELPPAAPAPQAPPLAELPDFDRDSQRRRFLLGISSPGSMARRLWSHEHYACCTGARWEDL